MDDKLIKVYAAYRSGCIGDNILDTYFPFFANIIYEQHWDEIDEKKIAEVFAQKYGIILPLTFVRQVLGIGMSNGSILDDHGQYIADRGMIKQFRFEATDFDKRWNKLRSEFGYYCKKEKFDLSGINIDERILNSLETLDEKIIAGDELACQDDSDIFDFAWKKFLVTIGEKHTDTYEFVACLSASNIMKQAIFFADSATETFNGLNVYLDSPMIFALLGMDVPARTESCKQLIEKAQEAGCSVFVFDHNWAEIEGIVTRAANWARDPDYSIDKANNVAKFFHDSDMSKQEIAAFCEDLEDKLADLNITIKRTNYDILSEQFQEDETKIRGMIEQRYIEQHQTISDEKKQSIAVDVRSIVMVYRERKGQVSTRIQTSREIMLTLNGTIANVSKKYESNQSLNSGHIPACISADLFGAVLLLFSPVEFVNYQKKQLLADCYIALRPNKKLIKKYVESLTFARNAGEIDEKKYLFMRSHQVVNDALMNVTKGDYARFNERTYREVYDEITEKAEQKYVDEAAAHAETQKKRDEADAEHAREIGALTAQLEQLKKADEKDTNTKSLVLGWVYTLLIAGIPYLVALTAIEIFKYKLVNDTVSGWIYAAVFVVITGIVCIFFDKAKKYFIMLAKKQVLSGKAKNKEVITEK